MDMGEQLRVIQVDEETVDDGAGGVKTPSEVLAEIIALVEREEREPAPTASPYGETGPPG